MTGESIERLRVGVMSKDIGVRLRALENAAEVVSCVCMIAVRALSGIDNDDKFMVAEKLALVPGAMQKEIRAAFDKMAPDDPGKSYLAMLLLHKNDEELLSCLAEVVVAGDEDIIVLSALKLVHVAPALAARVIAERLKILPLESVKSIEGLLTIAANYDLPLDESVVRRFENRELSWAIDSVITELQQRGPSRGK